MKDKLINLLVQLLFIFVYSAVSGIVLKYILNFNDIFTIFGSNAIVVYLIAKRKVPLKAWF